MLRILLPFVLVIGLVVIATCIMRREPLIRGIIGAQLVSPARPSVAFVPAAEWALLDARRFDTTVQADDASAASVHGWYALYTLQEAHEARLTCTFAEVSNPYVWQMELPDTPTPAWRRTDRERGGLTGQSDIFILPNPDDPWQADNEHELWQQACMVRRYVFTAQHKRFMILVEYREPLPAPAALPLADDVATLAAFEQRADAAFQLLRDTLPRPEHKLNYPEKTVDRRLLAKRLGAVENEQSR